MEVLQWTPELKIDDTFEGVVAGMPDYIYFGTGRNSSSRFKYLVYALGGSAPLYHALFISKIKEFKETVGMVKGTLGHSILLEGRRKFEDLVKVCEINLKAYSSPKASGPWKQFAKRCKEQNFIPLLPKEKPYYEWMAKYLLMHKVKKQGKIIKVVDLFTGGLPELSLFTNFPGTDIPFQIRVDYARIHDPVTNLLDLKTTSRSSNPELWMTNAYNFGAHIQAYIYPLIWHKLLGVKPIWNWVVMEQDPPFTPILCTPDDDFIRLGKDHTEEAVDLLKYCLRTGDWFPPTKAGVVQAPPFANYRERSN